MVFCNTRFYALYFFILLFRSVTCMASVTPANQDTILATSVKWEDQATKSTWLATLPQWDDDVVQSLFQLYQQAEHDTTSKISDNRYNISFINSYWGPLNNPFNKYPRPAKIFLIFNTTPPTENPYVSPPLYYAAPIIHNRTDGNDYVYDRNQKHPMLLNAWVNDLKQKNDKHLVMKFTICNQYGSRITDSCTGTYYQSESEYAINLYGFNSLKKKTAPLSAARKLNQSWESYAQHQPILYNAQPKFIMNDSVDWQDMTTRVSLLNTVTSWPNYQTIKDNFEKIRDLRYFSDERVANFPRRITWLYPDDDCWSRASASIKDFFGPFNNSVNLFPRPSKVFAFGNLCANTPNSDEGMVSWWFHTAAIVRDAETNQTYVLDPSVNALQPLPVEVWMNAISANSGACLHSQVTPNVVEKFDICNGYGSGPYLSCNNPIDATLRGEVWDSIGLTQEALADERSRQKQLGRAPDEVLGDNPPWKS